MIYIPILLIIIILSLDFYFTYSSRFENIKNVSNDDEKFDNEYTSNNEDETIFDKPNPWNKIQYLTNINKYFIEIDNLNEHIEKIMLWKSLPIIKSDLIDIDIENNYLILKTYCEEEALVICNLIINYINNNLTINDIISKNLINYTINKAKRYKLISVKLIELIKEGLLELNNHVDKILPLDYIDTDEIKEKEKAKIQKQRTAFINKLKLNDHTKNPNGLNKIVNNDKSDKLTMIDKPDDLDDMDDLDTLESINKITDDINKESFTKITPYEGNEFATINFH